MLHNATFSGLKMKKEKIVLTNGGSLVDSFEIRLYADALCAKYIKRRFINKSQTIVSNDSDGEAKISLKITDYYEIIPTILQ